MGLKISDRSKISPFIVMDVMRSANAREATGGDVLHLEVGQPSTPVPKPVIKAAKLALDDHLLGYTDALGIPLLKQHLAQYYKAYYGITIPSDRIIVTTGSSGAFLLSFLAVFEPGDKVGIPSPSYPAYKNILRALGIEVVEITVGSDTSFQLNTEILDNLKVDLEGLIIASPSNPTGTMLSDSSLKEICDWCSTQKIRLVSDEIYHGITFKQKATSALSYNEDTIIINSFSKYFAMTGWRLGWMIVPDNLVRIIECLAQNFFISPPTLSQLAAVSIFNCFDELNANVARYARNRNILLTELPKAGFEKIAPPDGAFYLYADVSSITSDSETFCANILATTGVALTPGIDFDAWHGREFVRFSYAGATTDIVEASKRLETSYSKVSHQ